MNPERLVQLVERDCVVDPVREDLLEPERVGHSSRYRVDRGYLPCPAEQDVVVAFHAREDAGLRVCQPCDGERILETTIDIVSREEGQRPWRGK